MQVRTFIHAAALSLAFVAVSAQAQTQAPGLWEHTIKPTGEAELAMAAAQQRLAAMPPEQRAQIEQMLAKAGVRTNAAGIVATVCVSKEEAAKPVDARLPDGCTQSDAKRSGNSMHYKFQCTKPQPSSGEGDVEFTGDKAYRGRATATSSVAGQPHTVAMEVSGKWLGADCGDVKPRTMPPR